MTQWLKEPYFEVDDPILKVDSTTRNMGSAHQEIPTVEADLQLLIKSTLGGISYWLNPTYFNWWPRDEHGMIDSFITTAVERTRWYPGTIIDPRTNLRIDPVAVGMNYGRKFVGILKQINSGPFTNGTEGKSLWDAWVEMSS